MRRVTAARPCPVCKKPDWCLVATDGSAAICPRVVSPRRCGDAGWLHKLSDAPDHSVFARRITIDPAPPSDLAPLADRCRRAADPGRLDGLAASLGVTVESLAALGVGWSGVYSAWTWPMTDPATDRVAGIRLRRPDGSKYAVKGGREGLFLPTVAPHPSDPLLVTEGATDAAAALTLGHTHVAGRPSCAGGTRQLAALVRSRRPLRLVLFADGDGPGLAGADRLADGLTKYAREVRVVAPPPGFKDLRDWVRAGATRGDLDALVAAAAPRVLAVRFTTTRGRR